tara:strand:+ start:153308 stop:154072 length:765 start_codon:yes stop_codon:yes gene_type:complete
MAVFLYQSSYLTEKSVEENYKEEYDLIKSKGHEVHHVLFDQIKDANLSFVKGKEVVYRGWMLTIEEYKELENLISENGGALISNVEEYKSAHYMPEWVDKLEGLTPKTHVFKNKTAALKFVEHHDGHKYFVKDFVKSLRGVSSSIVSHSEDMQEWLEQVALFRGVIEGGLCLREVENFKEETEQRFFVYKGKITSNGVKIPRLVKEIVDIIKLPFFTIDVVLNDKDEWRVVEIGDGQVSDSGKWDIANFPAVFE